MLNPIPMAVLHCRTNSPIVFREMAVLSKIHVGNMRYPELHRNVSRNLESIMEQPQSIVKHQKARLLNEKRFLSTIFMVSCISLFTFCPLLIYDSINGKPHYMIDVEAWSFKDVIELLLLTLFLANFWMNPVVYSWRLTRYRKTLSIVLRNFACKTRN